MNENPGQRSVPHGPHSMIFHGGSEISFPHVEAQAIEIPDPRAEEEHRAYSRQQVGGSSSSGPNLERVRLEGIVITYRLCVSRPMQGYTYFLIEVTDTPRKVTVNVSDQDDWIECVDTRYEMKVCFLAEERDPVEITYEVCWDLDLTKYERQRVIDVRCGVNVSSFDRKALDFSYRVEVDVLVRDERYRGFPQPMLPDWVIGATASGSQDAEAP